MVSTSDAGAANAEVVTVPRLSCHQPRLSHASNDDEGAVAQPCFCSDMITYRTQRTTPAPAQRGSIRAGRCFRQICQRRSWPCLTALRRQIVPLHACLHDDGEPGRIVALTLFADRQASCLSCRLEPVSQPGSSSMLAEGDQWRALRKCRRCSSHIALLTAT
jgi:hypothetical protein